MNPGKLQRNKQSTTVHNLLFCAHTLWLNYVTVTFLVVSSSGTNHDVIVFCARSVPKKRACKSGVKKLS